MAWEIIMIILMLVYGYFCLVLHEASAPFLAVFLIYFLIRIDGMRSQNRKMMEELEEIKKQLEALSPPKTEVPAEPKPQEETVPEQTDEPNA